MITFLTSIIDLPKSLILILVRVPPREALWSWSLETASKTAKT